MNEFLENLKRQATENPMLALAAGATVVTVITRFIGAGIDARNSHAWAKEVARRSMKDATKM
jgi:hypothetical protein